MISSNVSHVSDDVYDYDDDSYNPTPEKFQEYLCRDANLAVHNVKVMLGACKRPQTFAELYEGSLHSAAVLRKAINVNLTLGKIRSKKISGSEVYSLAKS